MKTEFSNLYRGLSQIPVWYLRNNLLPILKDPKSKLIFSGGIACGGFI